MFKGNCFLSQVILGSVIGLMGFSLQAGTPVWSFMPLTPTTVTGASKDNTVVTYRVTNQSNRAHTLVMNPIPGVVQITDREKSCNNPFLLPNKGSFCDLTLRVDRLELNHPITGGPIVCEQGNINQCYRPSAQNILRVAPAQEVVAYVASLNNNTVTRCSLLPDGNFDSCSLAGSDLPQPFGLGIHSSMLYVGDLAVRRVSRCSIDLLGNLIDCIGSSVSPDTPNGFTFSNTEKKIYIASGGENDVMRCDVDSQGGLINCISTGATGLNLPFAVKLNYEGTLAYIANRGAGTIRHCSVDALGNLSACADSAIIPLGSPVDVTFNFLGNRAYVLTTFPGLVYRCDVNEDATFSNCETTGSVSSAPRILVLNANETLAYISNTSNNFVALCQIDDAGNLNNCAQTGPGITSPVGIQLVAR